MDKFIAVGLDLSITGTGVAKVSSDPNIPPEGILIQTDPKDFNSPITRMKYIAEEIKNFLGDRHNIPHKYIYENYAFNFFGKKKKEGAQTGSNNITTLAELKGTVMALLHDNPVEDNPLTITTQQLKKFGCGHGTINQKTLKEITGVKYTENELKKKKKQFLIDGVNKNFNLSITDDNIADAMSMAYICLGLYLRSDLLVKHKITKDYQYEVLDKIKKSNSSKKVKKPRRKANVRSRK